MGADILFNNGHFGQLIERQLRRLVPGTVSRRRKKSQNQRHQAGVSACRHGNKHSADSYGSLQNRVHMDGCDLWRIGAYSHTVHGFGSERSACGKSRGEDKNLACLGIHGQNQEFLDSGHRQRFLQRGYEFGAGLYHIFIKYALKLPDSHATYLLGAVILIAVGGVVLWSSIIKNSERLMFGGRR